jgi:hypothetical protein
MEAVRDLLRGKLKSSLRGIRDEDRLAAAWTVACGRAMAEHGAVVGDAVWMRQMVSLGGVLQRELARIAGLPVAAIHFELKKTERRS